MIDDDMVEKLRAEFVRERDHGGDTCVRRDGERAWNRAIELLDLAATPQRYMIGGVPVEPAIVEVRGNAGEVIRADVTVDPDTLPRWTSTPAAVLDESDHRDRVGRTNGRGDLVVWRREEHAGCWHRPETTSSSGECVRHCSSSLIELTIGAVLRFADEPGTWR